MFKFISRALRRQPVLSANSRVKASTTSRFLHQVSPSRSVPSKRIQGPAVLVTVAGLCVAGGYLTSQTAYAEPPPKVSKRNEKALKAEKNVNASTCSLKDMPEISYDTSEANITGAKEELVRLLGADRVIMELGQRIAHSSTEWSEAPGGDKDHFAMIVNPRSTEEVSAIAKICHRRRIPMTGFSGGTSLEGTLAATYGGVCIDFRLMNKVLEVRKKDLDVTVQPSVGYEELNEKIAQEGLFFPPDPGPGAQIGGMIAQGCSGTNAYRYGTMKDWVLGMTLVLADGTIVKTRGRPRKSSSGYDLTRLIVGSEGTLAFVTEANLKLTSKPENERVAVAAFPSTEQAVDTAVKIVQHDLPLRAMELLCDSSMHAVNEGGYCEKEYAEVPTIFFKFAGKDKAAIEQQIQQVQQFARDAGCKTFEFSTNNDEAEAIWSARKTVLWSMIALKNDPSDSFLSADTAVPISALAKAVDETKNKIKAEGLQGFCLGHVGDGEYFYGKSSFLRITELTPPGNFHTGVLYPASEKKKARDMITWTQRQAIAMDGTVTGEHGIGLEFRDMVTEELGEGGVDLMRQIKLALDPLCLLNPDKVFRLKIAQSSCTR